MGIASCEVQEGHVWESLCALKLSEVRTYILGGNEVSLILEASCGLCSFHLPMGLGSEAKQGCLNQSHQIHRPPPSLAPFGVLRWSQGLPYAGEAGWGTPADHTCQMERHVRARKTADLSLQSQNRF